MALYIECPACEEQFSMPDVEIGANKECPRCGTVFKPESSIVSSPTRTSEESVVEKTSTTQLPRRKPAAQRRTPAAPSAKSNGGSRSPTGATGWETDNLDSFRFAGEGRLGGRRNRFSWAALAIVCLAIVSTLGVVFLLIVNLTDPGDSQVAAPEPAAAKKEAEENKNPEQSD